MPVVQPRWVELGKFLTKRRKQLSQEMGQELRSPVALRATTTHLPARWSNHRTISTLEDGRPLSMETLLFLPEMYRVGLQEIFAVLLPDYMGQYSKAADRLASMEWLASLVEAMSEQPESVVRMFRRMTIDGESLSEEQAG